MLVSAALRTSCSHVGYIFSACCRAALGSPGAARRLNAVCRFAGRLGSLFCRAGFCPADGVHCRRARAGTPAERVEAASWRRRRPGLLAPVMMAFIAGQNALQVALPHWVYPSSTGGLGTTAQLRRSCHGRENKYRSGRACPFCHRVRDRRGYRGGVQAAAAPDFGEILAWILSLPGPVGSVYEAGPTGFGPPGFCWLPVFPVSSQPRQGCSGPRMTGSRPTPTTPCI
jgi:hypothetical protein